MKRLFTITAIAMATVCSIQKAHATEPPTRQAPLITDEDDDDDDNDAPSNHWWDYWLFGQ